MRELNRVTHAHLSKNIRKCKQLHIVRLDMVARQIKVESFVSEEKRIISCVNKSFYYQNSEFVSLLSAKDI